MDCQPFAGAEGSYFNLGSPGQARLLRSDGERAAQLLCGLLDCLDGITALAGARLAMIAAHGDRVFECQDAWGGVIFYFDKRGGSLAGREVCRHNKRDGLAAEIHSVFGQEWFTGILRSKRVVEGRKVRCKEDAFHSLEGTCHIAALLSN